MNFPKRLLLLFLSVHAFPKASITGLEFRIRCSILSAILWFSQEVGEAATTA